MKVVKTLKLLFFIVFLLLGMVINPLLAQRTIHFKDFNILPVTQKKFDFAKNKMLFSSSPSLLELNGQKKFTIQSQSLNDINHLPLFCRLEEQVSRKSKIAMRMRLGSLEYVNQMEQKPNYKINIKN